jgi:hypothetical protein
MNILTRFGVILLLLTVGRSAEARVVDVNGSDQELRDEIELFRDPTRALDAERVAAKPFEVMASRANFGFTSDAIWLRVTLHNPRSAALDLVLDVAREWVEVVELWRLDPAEPPILVTTTGARIPLTERAVAVERAVVPVHLEANATTTYLVRVVTKGPLAIRALLATRQDYLNRQGTSELFFGGYYAILLGIAAFSLILFANLRDRLQAGIAGVLVSYALVEMCGHGHLSRLFPPGAGWLELNGLSVAFGGFSVATTFVSSEVSRIRSSWLRASGWCGAALCLSAAVTRTGMLTMFGVVLPMVATIVSCGLALRARRAHAWAFTIAMGVFTIPYTVTLLTVVGLLPAYATNEYANHAGAVTMSVLLSLIVANSINRAQVEIGQRAAEITTLNDELRFQVAARSRELVDVLARQARTFSSELIKQGDVFEERYRVVSFLGHGGMGSVYEVCRISDERRCALKVVTSARTGAEAARIAREAEIGARIVHPNLVQILDVGVAQHGPYLVMELVTGGALDSRRDRWGDAPWVLGVLRGVADGLEHLHRSRVVHRDLKPSNVLLEDQVAKVADFGIARASEAPLDVTGPTVDLRNVAETPQLTDTHGLVGTPLYMAPENARGETGFAVDVFAFGVMALELLSHQYPFDELPILAALAGHPHPPHRRATNVEEGLARVLDACVEADPNRRPTISEVAAVLSESS